MSEGITALIVKESALQNAPAGVRKFVQEFFERKNVFGIPCYVAVGTDFHAPWHDYNDEDYKEGLPQETYPLGVWDWFEKHPEECFKHFWS